MTASCGYVAARRMRSSAWVTLVRHGVRDVLCWSAFPLVPALRSTNSSADRSALFVGFIATMTGSDVPRSCVIGFGSSPSRCGPVLATGRTRDLPGSNAIPSCVMGSSTTAERQSLAYRDRTYCLRRCLPPRPLRVSVFRGSIAHPTGSLCTLRSRRHRRPRNTRYRAPATAYPDRTSTGWTAPACLAHKQSRLHR